MGSVAEPKVEPPLTETSVNIPLASYPRASSAPAPKSPEAIRNIASQSISQLNAVLESKNYAALSSLMLSSGCYWRDHLALESTKFSVLIGVGQILDFISRNGGQCRIRKFALENGKEVVVGGIDPMKTIKSIRALITFETAEAMGRGVINWVQDVENGDQWKVFTIYTAVQDLKNFPFMNGDERRLFADPHDIYKTTNWKEYRDDKLSFKDEDPAVLIVGG
jgi:hypothetical protein